MNITERENLVKFRQTIQSQFGCQLPAAHICRRLAQTCHSSGEHDQPLPLNSSRLSSAVELPICQKQQVHSESQATTSSLFELPINLTNQTDRKFGMPGSKS